MAQGITFIDTNVMVYHLAQTDHDHGPASSAMIARLRTGAERGYISSTVILECIHSCQTRYQVPNDVLASALMEMLSFPGVSTDHPEALNAALTFWSSQGPLSFADCFHLALTKQLGMTRIYSFDKKLNRYPGVERIEPS